MDEKKWSTIFKELKIIGQREFSVKVSRALNKWNGDNADDLIIFIKDLCDEPFKEQLCTEN